MLLPFLFTIEHPHEKPIVEKPVTPENEETKNDTTGQKRLVPIVPILPKSLVAQQADTLPKNDSVQKYIAEVVDNDTTTVGTVKKEHRTVPDIQPNGRMIANATLQKKVSGWNLAVAFAGGNDNSQQSSAKFPGTSSGIGSVAAPDTIINTSTRHFMPFTFSISLSKSLSPRWSIETGLRYTLLRSQTVTTTSVSDNSVLPTTEITEQKSHYIGIPLKLSYNLWSTRHFSFYTSGGAAADIPVGTNNPVL